MEKALNLDDMYINIDVYSMISDQIDPGSRSDSYFISGFP